MFVWNPYWKSGGHLCVTDFLATTLIWAPFSPSISTSTFCINRWYNSKLCQRCKRRSLLKLNHWEKKLSWFKVKHGFLRRCLSVDTYQWLVSFLFFLLLWTCIIYTKNNKHVSMVWSRLGKENRENNSNMTLENYVETTPGV